MKLRIISLLAVATVALTACHISGQPVKPAQPSPADDFLVAYLFTVDGCKVYRFFDIGETHYLTTCPGTVSSVHTSGETTVYDSIQTVVGDQ